MRGTACWWSIRLWAGVSDRLQELLKEAVSGDCEERLATLLELHFTLSLELGLDGSALAPR